MRVLLVIIFIAVSLGVIALDVSTVSVIAAWAGVGFGALFLLARLTGRR